MKRPYKAAPKPSLFGCHFTPIQILYIYLAFRCFFRNPDLVVVDDNVPHDGGGNQRTRKFSSTYLLIRIERDNQLHTKIFCTYTEPLTIVSIM